MLIVAGMLNRNKLCYYTHVIGRGNECFYNEFLHINWINVHIMGVFKENCSILFFKGSKTLEITAMGKVNMVCLLML